MPFPIVFLVIHNFLSDPLAMPPSKAIEAIGNSLQKAYERWQPRARYKQSLDPTVEEVKKLCMSLRRNAKEERVLFHYNGHGVPKPTTNGEIWVFNKVSHTRLCEACTLGDTQQGGRSGHLTPLSQPSSRLPQCKLGTHCPGTHTANTQALLHGSQSISVQERGEARQKSHAALPSALLSAHSPCLRLASNQLLTRQNPLFFSLSSLSLLCLDSSPPHTYRHTYTSTRPPIHGFITIFAC